MRVGFVQFRPVLGDTGANLETMLRLIASADADLLVLPEMANTGYTFKAVDDLRAVAEPFENSATLDALQSLAAKRDCALVVGFGERKGDTLYNSAVFLTPEGDRKLYRKVHLFGTENRMFTPGDIPFEVHEYRGTKLGMLICFDWFFPEAMRTLALQGAQIICHPVNFVLPWGPKAMTVRSLENHVFSITANRYGSETSGEYSFTFIGGSQVVSPMGEVIASAPFDGDSVMVVEIDPAQALNKRLNPFTDLFGSRRTEFYAEVTKKNGK